MSQLLYVNNTAGGSTRSASKLTFPDILCDPLIRMVMAADGVDPRSLKAELRQIAAARGLPPAAGDCACAS